MVEHYNGVFSALRTALWGENQYPLNLPEEKSEICKELRSQTVAVLTADVLGARGVLNEELRREWVVHASRNMMFWNHVMQEQKDLEKLLSQANIPFVVLKGAAAACYYSKPEYRTMGDVDIIVRPEDFERAFRAMECAGYRFTEYENDRHANFDKNGVLFELHRYFAMFDDKKACDALDNLIFEDILHAEEQKIGEFTFPMLPRLSNGLVLLAHIDQHMRVGLGLRQIIDWMLFVDQNLDDTWWKEEFGLWAKRLNLEKEAKVITRMCQIFLGLREDEITWCSKVDDRLCHDVMLRIMDGGNFGKKWDKEQYGVSVISRLATVKSVPHYLQARGCANWKALERYPWLRPFAWLYQLCRYIKLGLQREHPFRQLVQDIKQGKKQADILERIELGRKE